MSAEESTPPHPEAAAAAAAVEAVQIDEALQTRYNLCRSVAEECIQEEELMRLLKVRRSARGEAAEERLDNLFPACFVTVANVSLPPRSY